ncbi:DUF551 domain-containing protein [Bacteroides xylanisolvens]|uniref:DUF551 domain-containing protein n=1 Tax=Bacteroides xylanisolvens TaxID=371601 RepID=UPI001C3794C4|nr:DUF551 domain-containing protein [Bacteroides xylanisolvens]MBV3838423.1 DUF551 domain-containing protein [Bacteroides xylanisolvens]
MKQTLEEAAYDYATNKTKFRKEVLKEVDSDNYVSRKSDCMEDFQCGAEWHAKQSPWISVEDRLPKESGWVFVAGGRNPYRALFYCAGLFYSDVTLGTFDSGVTHWMPIPSFDEILEANRDVLERIKEKGD